MFFMCRYLRITTSQSSIMEYMVSGIFVHYDDNNEEIREAINGCLRFAAMVAPEMVLRSATAAVGRMKHRELCGELIEYCQQLSEDQTRKYDLVV
jgi:hypothetical protein